MKLGLISDIHANLDNLRRALALLRKLGADAILCAGDLADGESEGNAVVELIRENGISCVQGNHDVAIGRSTPGGWMARWNDAGFGDMPRQQYADMLNGENRAFLRELPPSRRFAWDSRRVLLTHASTWDQTTYVYAHGREAYLQRIAAEAEADIVILGHTHLPMAVEVEGVWVFNPGSVDGNRHEPHAATCALLDLPVTRYRVFDIHTGRPTMYSFTKLGDLGRNMHEAEGE